MTQYLKVFSGGAVKGEVPDESLYPSPVKYAIFVPKVFVCPFSLWVNLALCHLSALPLPRSILKAEIP